MQINSSSSPWWRHAVCYQIYVRSFADGNGDGVGDMAGIEQRLPYLADLGVDAVWITPFYPSPQLDHGYDVADYRDVDPLFGSLDDFDSMLATAHDLGIKLIADVVPNHTSHDHAWSARPSPPSPATRPGTATCSATAPARTAASRRTTGSRSSAARPGAGSRTASGTSTCSTPASPT